MITEKFLISVEGADGPGALTFIVVLSQRHRRFKRRSQGFHVVIASIIKVEGTEHTAQSLLYKMRSNSGWLYILSK